MSSSMPQEVSLSRCPRWIDDVSSPPKHSLTTLRNFAKLNKEMGFQRSSTSDKPKVQPISTKIVKNEENSSDLSLASIASNLHDISTIVNAPIPSSDLLLVHGGSFDWKKLNWSHCHVESLSLAYTYKGKSCFTFSAFKVLNSEDFYSIHRIQQKRNSQCAMTSKITFQGTRAVTLQDIQVVQNLIERCLQLYMNRDEVVNTLLDRASIEPGFTNLVRQKLEEEDAEFFKANHIRLKLKIQIDMFNQLLEQQYHLMKEQAPTNVMIATVQNGMHHMPGAVNRLPMGYPIMQPLFIPSTGYPHINSMGT